MTEVNRSNYEAMIPEIIEKIKKCNFVAIDAEYTGLQHPSAQNSLFDSAPERYQKLRKGFSNYSISQFGIAMFTRAWDCNKYDVDAYNIYLYPVAFDTFNDLEVLQCPVSSLNFLGVNNFDFNKFIKEGVPYLKETDKKTLRTYLKENRLFMRWMENRDKLYFPKFINKLNDEDIETIIDRLYGFNKVIAAIQESQKPVVGHNMLMDLILIIKQFYQDLPPLYEDFKKLTNELFPNIYDSKHISSALRNDLNKMKLTHTRDVEFLYDTSLFALYQNTSNVRDLFTPYVQPVNGALAYKKELDMGFDKNLETIKDSHCHEAALDACITGAVFARLAHISARRRPTFQTHRTFPPTMSESFSFVSEWKNYVNVVRATVSSINLAGKDPAVNRPNWIRVEGNPEKEIVLDLVWLRTSLPKYGDVEIHRINDGAVLLACGGWACARNVWSCLEDEGYKLSAQEFTHTEEDGVKFSRTTVFGSSVAIGALALYLIRKMWT